jgi:hypothetical protein
LKLKTINKMNIKDRLLLTAASFALGWLLVDATTMSISSARPNSTLVIDTIKPVKPQTIIQDVRGKKALFIGDSHTANHGYGWQVQLCQATGLIQNNISVGGKTTSWMLQQAQMYVTSNYDYCFIYGGANDMYNSHISAGMAFNNIQYMVNICKYKGVKPIVLTGFDYSVCTRTENKAYPGKGAELQRMLLGQLQNATVVDTRVVYRSDCGDALCHMNYSGHQKMAQAVIRACKFRKY